MLVRICQAKTRSAVIACVTALVLATTVSSVVAPSAAQASTPTAPTMTPVAARTNAAGGSADLAYVDSHVLTSTPNGSLAYYDSSAHQIREVDGTTKTVSVLAGSGATSVRGPLDTTAAATSVPLPDVDGLWTDTAGDVFAWTCFASLCASGHDLYRLDHADGRWHLAVSNPELFGTGFRWSGFAVAPAGDVIAVDVKDHVINRISAGADPSSTGSVVAGTYGSTGGMSGDGGPATAATIVPAGPVAISSAGDIFFADGGWQSHLRHVDASGVISELTDPAASSSPADNSIYGLTTSADGATVYVERESIKAVVRAIPLDGSAPTTVAGPIDTCNSGTQGCLGSSIAEVDESGTTSVVSAVGSIDSWPADGSDPTRYHRYAGVLNDALGVRSPDGTRLDQAYLTGVNALAVSTSGEVALAARDGVRTLTGLSPDSTLHTLAAGIVATTLQYADDGTLYALVPDPTRHVVAISPSGTVTTVVGGGNTPAAAGVNGTDAQLPYGSSFAVDAQNGAVFFDDGNSSSIWEIAPGAQAISLFGDARPAITQAGALAVAGDHSVLVDLFGYGSLARLRPDGSSSLLCAAECPDTQVQQLGDGLITGLANNTRPALLGTDGTVEELAADINGASTVTPDGRELAVTPGASPLGLLAESGALAAPQPVDAPTVQTTASPAGVSVKITPTVAHQQIDVSAFPEDGSATVPVARQDYTSDGTAQTVQLRHLFSTWPAAAGSNAAKTFKIQVVATEPGDSTHDAVTNAPQTYDVTPLPDSTPPSTPTIKLGGGATLMSMQVSAPTDPDLDRVVVCRTSGVAVAADPRTCDDIDEVRYFDARPSTIYATIDPTVATTFTAFAVDDAGNVSAPASATRSAAGLVSGDAVNQVYAIARPGVERVVWQPDWAAHVRYATGSTPPAGPNDGTEAGQYDGGGLYPNQTGYFADIPVAPGAKVAVSLFTWVDQSLGSYRRTEFVLTGGTSSDAATVSATSRVLAGSRPLVQVKLLRHAPTGGSAALAGKPVTLYRRTVGSAAWTPAGSGTSTAAGTVNFTVPVPTGATQYEARSVLSAETLSSAAVTTLVGQTLTISAPARATHRRAVSVTGRLNPYRASTVYLQSYRSRRWVNVASARSGSNGAYRITYRPASKGTQHLRTYVSPTRTLLTGASRTATLIVR
ncbi:hypothetical protein [uncultured Jatrophihabitans sp.]|uniref:hypothetical protein n=1 Tax=uncultured Jatrophihabitans sp. TaxID=1610747 RepID=UPI0035CAC23A